MLNDLPTINTNMLSTEELYLLNLLLKHNDTDKVIAAYTEYIFEQEKETYKEVMNDWLLENLSVKAHKEAKAALPALGTKIVNFGHSLGGKMRITK